MNEPQQQPPPRAQLISLSKLSPKQTIIGTCQMCYTQNQELRRRGTADPEDPHADLLVCKQCWEAT